MNKFNIGQEVLFIDTKDECVKSGKILGIHVSTTGYILYNLIIAKDGVFKNTTNNTISREEAFIHTDKKEAEEALVFVLEKQEEMKEKADATEAIINKMREDVLGKPTAESLKQEKA